MKIIATQKTIEAYDQIIQGAGWCTSDYIINFLDLSPIEMYHLMLHMSGENILVNEGEMTENDIDQEDLNQISDSAMYTQKGIEKDYMNYFNLEEF